MTAEEESLTCMMCLMLEILVYGLAVIVAVEGF